MLEPPNGIEMAGSVGDLAADDITGSAAVRSGQVTVDSRECNKKSKKTCAQERALQREMMHMEAALNDGESVLPQFHCIEPRRMEGKKMPGEHVAAGCLTNALRACTDRHFKFSNTIGNVIKKGKAALQKACLSP